MVSAALAYRAGPPAPSSNRLLAGLGRLMKRNDRRGTSHENARSGEAVSLHVNVTQHCRGWWLPKNIIASRLHHVVRQSRPFANSEQRPAGKKKPRG